MKDFKIVFMELVRISTLNAMRYEKLTHTIIGCAMRIHSKLGNGFQEVIYQRCLVLEFQKALIDFERELEMNVYYDGVEVGIRRVDFLVEGKIMVEIKAVTDLNNIHLAQTINYLEAYDLPIGLLLNFGYSSLQYKRVYNTKHPENQHHRDYPANL